MTVAYCCVTSNDRLHDYNNTTVQPCETTGVICRRFKWICVQFSVRGPAGLQHSHGGGMIMSADMKQMRAASPEGVGNRKG